MTTELTTFDGLTSVSQGLRDPNLILAEAKERATALREVVKQTGASLTIGKSEHLKIEAWVTIGAFYNCTARVKEAEPVEIGSVFGFKAHALLVHDPSGQILSEADAYCMRDEERWKTRPKYEWPNGQKTQVGEEEVPLFQLASMAQTRAMAKVLAAKFRWVVVLGGFNPTPAEEMTGNEQNHETPERKTYTLKPKAAVARPIPYGPAKGKLITEAETADLEDFVTRKRQAIEAGKVDAKWLASDTLLCDAINAELAARKEVAAKALEEIYDDEGPVPEFTNEAWEAVILEWSAKHGPLLKQVKDQHKVKEVGKIAAKDRADFYALMQDAINAET
jgi:hypothetical protein